MAANDTLDPRIMDEVANAKFNILATAPAFGLGQALSISAQNMVNHQQQMQQIGAVAMMEFVRQSVGMDISESIATKKASEADLARSVMEMGATLAGVQAQIQGLAKIVGTQPPVTVKTE